VHMAFSHVGLTIRWEGEGVDEVGILDAVDAAKYEVATGRKLNVKSLTVNSLNDDTINVEPLMLNGIALNDVVVRVDPIYFRPTEVDLLLGDPTKSKTQLGWTPEYDLAGLVEDMMISDIKLVQKDMHLVKGGHEVYRQSE